MGDEEVVLPDYYFVLGIERDADERQIKSCFKRKALRCHPDKNPGDSEAERKFKELYEAYNVLSNVALREEYNKAWDAGDEEAEAAAMTSIRTDPVSSIAVSNATTPSRRMSGVSGVSAGQPQQTEAPASAARPPASAARTGTGNAARQPAVSSAFSQKAHVTLGDATRFMRKVSTQSLGSVWPSREPSMSTQAGSDLEDDDEEESAYSPAPSPAPQVAISAPPVAEAQRPSPGVAPPSPRQAQRPSPGVAPPSPRQADDSSRAHATMLLTRILLATALRDGSLYSALQAAPPSPRAAAGQSPRPSGAGGRSRGRRRSATDDTQGRSKAKVGAGAGQPQPPARQQEPRPVGTDRLNVGSKVEVKDKPDQPWKHGEVKKLKPQVLVQVQGWVKPFAFKIIRDLPSNGGGILQDKTQIKAAYQPPARSAAVRADAGARGGLPKDIRIAPEGPLDTGIPVPIEDPYVQRLRQRFREFRSAPEVAKCFVTISGLVEGVKERPQDVCCLFQAPGKQPTCMHPAWEASSREHLEVQHYSLGEPITFILQDHHNRGARHEDRDAHTFLGRAVLTTDQLRTYYFNGEIDVTDDRVDSEPIAKLKVVAYVERKGLDHTAMNRHLPLPKNPRARAIKGEIMKTNFAALLRQRYPDAQKAFAAFDDNKNGTIGRLEFLTTLQSSNYVWNAEKVFLEMAGEDRLLSNFELNKAWKLTRKGNLKHTQLYNFSTLLRHRYGNVLHAFEALDFDKSGQISQSEFMRAVRDLELVWSSDELWRNLAVDSGITVAEFTEIWNLRSPWSLDQIWRFIAFLRHRFGSPQQVLEALFGSDSAQKAVRLDLEAFQEKILPINYSGDREAVFYELSSGREALYLHDIAPHLTDAATPNANSMPSIIASGGQLLWKYNFAMLLRNCFTTPEEAFDTLDTDKDAHIGPEEFSELGDFYGLAFRPEKIYKALVRPSTGSLRKQDFQKLWSLKNEAPSATKARIEQMKSRSSQSIQAPQLGHEFEPPVFLRRFAALLRHRFESVDAAFAAFDMDGNGRLTASELGTSMKQLQFNWKLKDVFESAANGRKTLTAEDIKHLWHFRDAESTEVLIELQDQLRLQYNSPDEVVSAFFPGNSFTLNWEEFTRMNENLKLAQPQLVRCFRELADGDFVMHVDKLDMCCLLVAE